MALQTPVVIDSNGDLCVLLSGDLVNPAALGTGSLGTGTKALFDDGTYKVPTGGGSATIQSGTATLDFGVATAGGVQDATAVVTGQTGILPTSTIWLEIRGDATSSNRTAKDHRYVSIFMQLSWGAIVAGTGFTIYGTSSDQLTGQYTINWYWS